MESCLSLEPLAGEAQVDVGAGCGTHPAEGQVSGLPDHVAGAVGGEDRTADVVGAHGVEGAVLEDRHDGIVSPDVLPDQLRGTAHVVVEILRDPVAPDVVERVDRVARCESADHLLGNLALGSRFTTTPECNNVEH